MKTYYDKIETRIMYQSDDNTWTLVLPVNNRELYINIGEKMAEEIQDSATLVMKEEKPVEETSNGHQ